MPNAAESVSQMRQALAVTEPDLDTTIGTTVRKVLDVVGEMAEEVSVDRYLLDYQYDIDTKQGADLDDFVGLLGFSRLPAKRAVGSVTFERSTPGTTNTLIPVGTQVASDTNPTIVFATVVPAVLMAGETAIEVPIQAINPGAAGNVSASLIERFVNAITGITSFSNLAATSGGEDAEGDDALRERFKRTVFRNLAGTEAMFLSTALNNEHVTQANVIGATKRRTEQIEIVNGGATSTIQDAKTVYPNTSFFGVDLDGGQLLTPGVHYEFDAANPPNVLVLDTDAVPDGIYELEFEYVPLASRNDPNSGITNRIDIYVDGSDPQPATDLRVWTDTAVFTDATGSPTFRGNFRRTDGTLPQPGNFFLALSQTPVLDPTISDQIVIGVNTYEEGTDYFLVNDVSPNGGTYGSLSGIEWISVANGAPQALPAVGTAMDISYLFNAVPRDVALALRDWRLVCTDVQVHAAKPLLLNLYLVVILEPGFSEAAVLSTMEFDLRNLINSVGFNGALQTSDILAVAHQVAGVDAVRFATDIDNDTDFAIQQVAQTGAVLHIYSTADTPRRAVDVLTGDDEVVVLNSVTLYVRAQNSFGST